MHILVTVTLNVNQLRAHLEPIVDAPEVSRVTLLVDAPRGQTYDFDESALQMPMEKINTVQAPSWLVRICGRALAKLLIGLTVAVRDRPTWVIGYNLVPHGINAVLIARVTGRKSYVHVIGGPAEWRGGGIGSDNKVLSRLRRPSSLLERLLIATLRKADIVAVMGSRAQRELVEHGLEPSRVVVLPASVDETRFIAGGSHRRWDIVTAVQLIPRKRVHELLLAFSRLHRDQPELRAAIAGRGPLLEELRAEARHLGIEHAVDFLGFVADVERVYASARVFVLPSQREGLSIAMTEAMAAGVPVVVTDIGEARDVVTHGENGFLYEVGDVDALESHLRTLLRDDASWERMSRAAVAAVRRSSARDTIQAVNRRILTNGRQPEEA